MGALAGGLIVWHSRRGPRPDRFYPGWGGGAPPGCESLAAEAKSQNFLPAPVCISVWPLFHFVVRGRGLSRNHVIAAPVLFTIGPPQPCPPPKPLARSIH